MGILCQKKHRSQLKQNKNLFLKNLKNNLSYLMTFHDPSMKKTSEKNLEFF